MDERVRFIVACREERNFREVCRRFGISPKTGYKWVARYNQLGVDGLKDRAPVVRAPAHRLGAELEAAIVLARKSHPTWGPKKLRAFLLEAEPARTWPAASTVGEVLKRNGLIRPRRFRIRVAPGASPLAACEQPNDTWCIDFKGHFALGDKTRCHPLTVSDAASRYLLKCEGLTRPREAPVREQLELAFREFGLPTRIRSDNGPPFATMAAGGLSALSIWWVKLGIVPERIEPGHPEQNGRHERMHRTLKADVVPAENMAEQQRRFDAFRYEYNEVRPHEALGQVPPVRRYEPSGRPFPATLPSPEYEDCAVRWTHGGVISWRSSVVRVGPKVLSNEPVGLTQVSESEWEVRFGPVLLGVLDERDSEPTLRPTRNAATEPLESDCEPANRASQPPPAVSAEPQVGPREPNEATANPDAPMMEMAEAESVT